MGNHATWMDLAAFAVQRNKGKVLFEFKAMCLKTVHPGCGGPSQLFVNIVVHPACLIFVLSTL